MGLNPRKSKIILRVSIIFLAGGLVCTHTAGELNDVERTCATLFSGDYSDEFEIKENQQISDFDEHHHKSFNSLDTWNSTSSISVTKGCTFTACTENYFGGNCQGFRANVPKLTSEFRKIGSANCTCESVCKCEDIKLRKTECARAYIGKRCNSCDAYYADFRTVNPNVGDTLKNNIASILVRPGCEIEVFDDTDYDGTSQVLKGVNEEWSEEVHSYKCSCKKPETYVKPETKRPLHYPPLIKIPSTQDEIVKLLSGENRHPGLMAALKSVNSKRSPKNAYILLLGLTGAGKSSCINLLFDNPNITKIGDASSVTSDIHEFRIPVPVDELGISNSELRVIDTPGLSDTRGLEHDAKFLTTLEEYLNNHEELSQYKPNIVMVFAKFNENRYSGDGTNFVKMLRGIDNFHDKLTDKKYSNVVFVLSHYMSEVKKIRDRPTERLSSFKKTIEDYSLFPRPIAITVAENKAQDEDLLMLNGYYKLPNGEFYTKNLFDKIQKATISGSDPIGEAIIRTAFKNSDDFKITSSVHPLVESNSTKVLKYLGILSGANFKYEDTETSRALAVAYQTMDNGLKKTFPDSLPYLQRSFNIRNIHTKANIPKTTVNIVKFLKEIRQNAANIYLMEKAFSLKMPELKGNLLVGYGYNVIQDSTLTTTPFVIGTKQVSDIGYLIPSGLTCQMENNIKNFYESFSNKGNYVSFRLKHLNVQGSVPMDDFKGTVKPGCNIIANVADSGQVFTGIREHRLYELILNDKLELTSEFKEIVKKLPTYNASDYQGIEMWKKFFGQYGTHVVKSAHGGGSIEIQMKSTNANATAISTAMFELIQFAEDIRIGKVGGLNLDKIQDHTLKFTGGDFKYHTTTFTGMSLADITSTLENWKESLAYNPVMLQSDMKLIPISEFAKKIGPTIAGEIQRAAAALFNSSLVYVPPPKIKVPDIVPPVARANVETPKANDNRNDNGNDWVTPLVKLMMEESRKSDERFEKRMDQLNIDARERQTMRDKERAEDRKWQREREAKLEDLALAAAEREKDRQLMLDKHAAEERKEAKLQRIADEKKEKEEERLRREEQERSRQSYLTMMANIANRPPPVIKTGGCLKKGTLIRLNTDGAQIAVENVKVGDMVLDMNLKPNRVFAVSAWFLGDQKFYGFNKGDEFFTETHMFVGPKTFHVVNKKYLLEMNPLMAALEVEEFPQGGFNTSNYEIGNLTVELTMDPSEYPPDTLVYFIQVESLTGTYFANDFICRHEIPPFKKWPNTMATLFTAFADPRVQFVKKWDYCFENLQTVSEIIGNLYPMIEHILRMQVITEINADQDEVKVFADFHIHETMGAIFQNNTFSNLAIGVYSKCGPMMSEVLDSHSESPRLQKALVELIIDEISRFDGKLKY